jgi:hypothetical protein
LIRTQNTGCAPAVPNYWIIDQKRAEGVGSAPMALNLRGVIVPGRMTSPGFEGAGAS